MAYFILYWTCASLIAANAAEEPELSSAYHAKSNLKLIGQENLIHIIITSNVSPIVCASTIFNAFRYSWNSSRVNFHIYDEMYRHSMSRCVQQYCKMQRQNCQALLRSGRLRASFRHHTGMNGVSGQKYFAEQLLDIDLKILDVNDQFFLSVDGSAVFAKHWDIQVLEQWYLTGNDKAIISTSPKAYEYRKELEATVLELCSAHIVSRYSQKVVEYNSPIIRQKQNSLPFPILQSLYSEAYFFGPVASIANVPSDPYLTNAATGFVYARAARFWTFGYDFYAPFQDALYMRYDLEIRKKSQTEGSILQYPYKRIRGLFGLTDGEYEEQDIYALGKARSMNSWIKFSRIDPTADINGTSDDQFHHCGQNLPYIHYRNL